MINLTKDISMLLLSILVLVLLVMAVLTFMLGFTHPLPWMFIAALVIIPIIHNKIVARRFVKWDDSFSVGIDLIDNDHKKLLDLLNQLQLIAHYKTDEALIDSTFDELIDYTKYHFSREEKLMELNNYPDFEEHKKEHAEMMHQTEQFINEYKIEQSRTIENVITYLKSWLINHINGSDQKYTPFIKNTQIDQ